jgi:hypothetical protein
MSLGRGGRTSSSHMDSHNSWYKNRGQGTDVSLLIKGYVICEA